MTMSRQKGIENFKRKEVLASSDDEVYEDRWECILESFSTPPISNNIKKYKCGNKGESQKIGNCSNSITHNIDDGEYSSENEDISDGGMLPTIHRPLLVSSTRRHHSKHQQALKNFPPSSRPSSSQSFTSDEDFKTKVLQQLSAIKVNLIKLNRKISLLENSKETVSKEDTIENETSKQYEEFINNIFPLQNEEDLVVVEVKLEEEPGFKVKLVSKKYFENQRVMVTRQWRIIAFDEGVQIVPKNWIKGEDCFWLNFKSILPRRRLVYLSSSHSGNLVQKGIENFKRKEVLASSDDEVYEDRWECILESFSTPPISNNIKKYKCGNKGESQKIGNCSNSITHNIDDGEYSSENEDISDGGMLPTIHRPLLVSSTRRHHSKHQQALKNFPPSSRPSSSQSFTSDEDFKTKVLQQLSAIKVNLIKLNRKISLLENSKETVSKEDTIENETSKQYEEFINNIFPLQNEEDLVVVEVKLEEEPGFKVKLVLL
ncbi:hypothetical protein FQA39_LY09956 [Lamprigera yunnana]|nr:hypothetical protein FQA39_LY09956 [Lamprigera yunnana]